MFVRMTVMMMIISINHHLALLMKGCGTRPAIAFRLVLLSPSSELWSILASTVSMVLIELPVGLVSSLSTLAKVSKASMALVYMKSRVAAFFTVDKHVWMLVARRCLIT